MKLLLVDTNKTFQNIIGSLFAEADIEIGVAESAAKALEMAPAGWHFVCLALHLPDLDGLSLCRRLRGQAAFQYTPIILFTGDDTEALHREATSAGITEVFLKKNVADLIHFVGRYSARVKKIEGRVLYVEDSAAQALLMQELLSAQGLTVSWCGSGDEAWAAFQTHGYDLVLTDLVLTDSLGGAALIGRIRSLPDERGDVPIVAVTGFDHQSRRIELFHLGVNDYVTKPIVAEELISRLRNLIEHRHAEQALKQQQKRHFDETLLQLSRGLGTVGGNLTTVLEEVCRRSAEAMAVARVGIWQLATDHSQLRLRASFGNAMATSAEDVTLAREDYPAYFQALATERIIVASDALQHSATGEFGEHYLIPNGIGAMLDVPLGAADRRVGVICHEHVGGVRVWTAAEESFAAAVGDLVTLAIESHERWLADQQLRLAGLVFEAASEAIVVCDRDNRIVTANEAFTAITGYTAADVVGKTPAMFKSGRHDTAFYAAMWASIAATGKWQGEIWDRRKDGTEYPKRLSITRVLDEQGEVSHYIGVFADVSKEKADQEKLRYLAYNDVLTELPNRIYAESMLGEALALAERDAHELTVMCIDIDRFKKINSSFGHSHGDTLLKEAARRLRGALCSSARLARWSGAGFLAILDLPADAERAATIAQRCLDAFRQPFAVGQSEIHLALSIGIGLYPRHGRDAGDLVKNTVAALNHAKEGGGNRYVFFNADMEQRTVERLLLESRLRRALDQQHFVLHYQPKVDAGNRRLVGREALVRWNDPIEGLIPPGRFIGLAEETGQIFPLNDWVLHEACRQTAAWLAERGETVPVAVNLPAGAFTQRDVVADVRRILADTGLPPALLELELTESAAMDDPQRAVEVFAELKGLGVSIAIDDFGTGYSSLAYLKRLPIDTLKIDRSFVTGLGASDDELVIVSSIVGLARSLNLNTVAEGIERDAQGNVLRDLGCSQFQGYLFGRPLPATEVTH